MDDTLTSKSYSLNINVIKITTTLSTTLNTSNKPIVTSGTENYDVVIKTDNPNVVNQNLIIELPPAVTVNNQTSLQNKFGSCIVTSNETSTRIAIPVKLNKEETVTLNVTFSQSGYWSQTVSWSGATDLITSFLVQSETFQQLGFTRIKVPDYYTEGMGHNVIYRLGVICKHVIDNTKVNLIDWKII